MGERRGMLSPLPMEGRATLLPFRDSLPGSVMNEREWAVPGMLAGAYNAFIAPERVRRGMLDPSSEEAMMEALNVAGYPMLAGAPAMAGARAMPGMLGVNVFHGTQATRNWMDNPDLMALMNQGKDIPRGAASSTLPIETLRVKQGGLKLMDGIGAHVGTADAANQRLAKYHGIPPSKAWSGRKLDPRLEDSYVMPFDLQPKKPFTKTDGSFYTEAQLQSRLADIGEKLGFSRSDLRHYSTKYATPAKMKEAQRAIRKYLLDLGHDAVPYINSHEARGSVSWVVLEPENLRAPWAQSSGATTPQ
jgi:hypothetical protein